MARTKPTALFVASMALIGFLALSVQAADRHAASYYDGLGSQLVSPYGTLPVAFEANQGQADPRVKFISRGRGYSLFFMPDEAVLVLRHADRNGQQPTAEANPTSPIRNLKGEVLRLKIAGGNPQTRVVGLSELPGKVNYLLGNDPTQWRTNIPTYGKVRYENASPGVNVIYYGTEGQLEFDLVLDPGIDPRNITLAFEGAQRLDVDERGDLVLKIADGELKLRKPLVYQEVAGLRKQISADYVLGTNPKSKIQNQQAPSVGFQVASYDASKPLIIDPVLVYSSYLGGTLEDKGFGIAVNGSGNAFVVGSSASESFNPANPATDVDYGPGGGTDVFIAKLNAAGSGLEYLSFIGGSGEDQGLAIALDSTGNAYITGKTNSGDFPVTASAAQLSKSGSPSNFDAFVAKLNATGSALLYSTYLGGSQDESANAIAVDGSGNVYVAGQTKSTNFPIKNALRSKTGGVTDVFVAKVDASQTGLASLVYATYVGGSGDDSANGIAVDSSGNAYVTGTTVSSNFPTTNKVFDSGCGTDPKGSCNGGFSDAFVLKLNSTGSALVYSTYLGGSGADVGNGIAVDTSGNAYVTGSTASTNFPVTNGAFDTTYAGGAADAFVAKLNATGSALIYSTYLGGGGSDAANAIALDASGNAYVTGATTSTDFPVASPYQGALAAGDLGGDAFVTKLDSTGSSLFYSTYLGGSRADQAFGIAVDASRDTYVTGSTASSTGFPTGSFQPAYGGGAFDGFVAKLHDQASANNDSYTTAEDTPLVVAAPGVLANDSGAPLTAILVSGPSQASSFNFNANGSFSYTPLPNISGINIDQFTYKANDGVSDTNVATVTITVTPVNDAPVLATNAGLTVNEGGSGTITIARLQVTDVDNTAAQLVYTVTVLPANGSLRRNGSALTANGTFTQADIDNSIVTYQHNGSETTSDAFTFTVSDGAGGSIGATVFSITVTPINDSPVAAGQSVTTDEDTPKIITLRASDVDSSSLTFSLVSGPTHGGVGSISGTSCTSSGSGSNCTASVTYTPAANYNGTDSFTFKVNDGSVDSAAATVSITINAVNDAPVAANQTANTSENTPVTITLSASDIDSASLSFSGVFGPGAGTLSSIGSPSCTPSGSVSNCTASVTYTPGANFSGSDSFAFKASDGAADSNVATVTISVAAINNAPFFDPIADEYPNTNPFAAQDLLIAITGVSAGPVDELATQSATLSAQVIASNPPGLVTILNNPLLGSGSTRRLMYEIPANTTGTARIRVTADDGQSTNNAFSRDIAVTVQAPGTPPPAVAAIIGLTLGSAFVNYQVTFNPLDLNGDGAINSSDCYSVFPPQPQNNPFNLFPSGALVTPEAPPATVDGNFDITGFGTTQICTTARSFAGVIDLSAWGINTAVGELAGTIDFTYVNFVRDPELESVVAGSANCGSGALSCKNILVGSFPAGSISFTLGGTVSEKNTVLIHSVELQSGFSTKNPLAHVETKVFDRSDRAFQNQRFGSGGGTRVGQNPSGSLYGAIFEAADPSKGLIASCETEHNGICLTTEPQAGSYLVIIKYEDGPNGKIVYEGQTLVTGDFADTSVPPDGVGDFAQITFEIIRKNRQGEFQEYQGGNKTVVCNTSNPGCIP